MPEYKCPECGGTEWKADYYQAVWQTVTLEDNDGAPVFGDYTGVTGSYDDGSTQDEAYRCCSCSHTVELGTFRMLPILPENVARVVLEIDHDAEQLERVQRRAAELDAGNLGTTDAPESYSAALAFARVLASDERLTPEMIPAYSVGYTAEPFQ